MKTSIRKKIRVVAAMSGGVDSAVAAAILKNDGFDVVGVTLKTFEMPDCSRGGSNRCCSLRDIEDARAVAAHLGIAHYVMDFSREFKKHVIDYFVSEYLR
ncbi:MAG: asparagine synthase-related protein, partial [Candidatus Omnitrophota bacterium]